MTAGTAGDPARDRPGPGRRGATAVAAEPAGRERNADRGHAPGGSANALLLAALGVVFGDIGTSPLYALQTVFAIDRSAIRPTSGDVYGIVSLLFWSVTIVVSVKYVGVVMRANNDGEGGVMALVALVRRALGGRPAAAYVVALGILGASLFYGDSLITPAISVLSAVEGLRIAAPSLGALVLPVAATILAVLFAVQRFGTGRVGSLFGPVMLLWFGTLALGGLVRLAQHPATVRGLSPTYAVAFVVGHPYLAFVAVGAVVLVITGAEALYADMGHFGRPPIARAWFFVVFPALTLTYLGQASLILADHRAVTNPFFLTFPSWARIPMVVLATGATVIASQAVISGAFSVTRQGMQLGLMPPVTVRQTSREAGGQIYLPAVNWALFVGVLVLVLSFRTSARLATAYGVAVTGALLIDTALLLVLAGYAWRWPVWKLAVAGAGFGLVELSFLAGNLTKVAHGGWLPLLIAAFMFTTMTTWQRGRVLVTESRTAAEGHLHDFVEDVRRRGVARVAGTAVFPHPSADTTPLALRANVRHNHVIHEHVVIVTARSANVPRVPDDERLEVDNLEHTDDGIWHLTVRYGFSELPDIPGALRAARGHDRFEVDIDPDTASYFLSRASLRRTPAPGMASWRKAWFLALTHVSAPPAVVFGLPPERTVVMGSQIEF